MFVVKTNIQFLIYFIANKATELRSDVDSAAEL